MEIKFTSPFRLSLIVIQALSRVLFGERNSRMEMRHFVHDL